MPVLGIQFDIRKVESGDYGTACWKVLWRAVDPQQLRDSLLFDGDLGADRYCIAVESLYDPDVLTDVRAVLERDPAFQAVAASPQFLEEGSLATALVPAGQVDSAGNLVGDALNARPALGAVRRETGAAAEVGTAAPAPEREKPASRRTAQLPTISSLDELLEFLLSNFGEEQKHYFWLSPEELCDIVERYSDILQVQWYQGSSGVSENGTYIDLLSRGEPRKNITLVGLFPFASELDARRICRDPSDYPQHLIGSVEERWGLRGKFATNFEGHSHSNSHGYDEEESLEASELWARICIRRQTLGLPVKHLKELEAVDQTLKVGETATGAELDNLSEGSSTAAPAKRRRWWRF